MRWAALAPGKVNLALFLGPVRDSDRRHELVSLFQSVSLADEVTMTIGDGGDEVICEGVEGPNLAEQALRALRSRGWAAPPVVVEIVKHVPVAAGMGGGSGDAAAVLRLAGAVAPLPAGFDLQLEAARLGADVPSQLEPGLCLGTGAGEVVASRAPLASFELVIVPLPAALSTAAVYDEADRLGLGRTASELAALAAMLDSLPAGARIPPELLVNDLEPASVSLEPAIAGALDAVRGEGADHAFVCGSGPTVAGLFWSGDGAAAGGAERAALELRERFAAVRSAAPVLAEFAAATFVS